jgi:hypothetical protein
MHWLCGQFVCAVLQQISNDKLQNGLLISEYLNAIRIGYLTASEKARLWK